MGDFMNTAEINKKHYLAMQKMDIGDYEGALEITDEIKNMGTHYYISYAVACLLTDIGVVVLDKKLIIEGIELFEKNLEEILKNNIPANMVYYNLANAYSNLSSLKRADNKFYAIYKESEIDTAISYYRKALEFGNPTPELFVNLGSNFNHSGRVIDALDCYNEALNLNPEHGMALGNKGMGLYYYAHLSGEHEATFFIEAYSLLSKSLELPIHLEATPKFEEYLTLIENKFSDKKYLTNPPEFPGIKIETEDEFERYMITFCKENQLYLNICNFCQKCQASIGDSARIKQMLSDIKDIDSIKPSNQDYFYRFSAYLNQIKQDYITARFLLTLSRCEDLNLNFVDKHVGIANTFNYNQYNVYIQLLKFAFKNFYDVLDKIAFFIDDYLNGLGLKEWQISFRKIWYKKGDVRKKIIHPDIEKIENFSLNALFKIHKDLEDENEILSDIRNGITHRFIQVRLFSDENGNNNIMKEEELFEYTLELAKIVRNAIIYLLQFVDTEERKKKNELENKNIPIGKLTSEGIPDYLKSDRHYRTN